MNIVEEAIIYATNMHAGQTRKSSSVPYILHPLEVAQIISTITDDKEIICAGILHDVVEDTDGTVEDIVERFGNRVAKLVASETENKYESESRESTWKRRKEESLRALRDTDDIGVKILWLADKLSNIRSIVRNYSEMGSEVWNVFHQKDPLMHKWYYQSVAESVELSLNKTGAFKEMVEHINYLWPGTFSEEKSRYKKYYDLSIDGLELIGKGAKGNVYKCDDELIVKVYNDKNFFKDIERERLLAKKAFIAGIPTAISFGIVTVNDRYGSVFELIDSECISETISNNPEKIDEYAKAMSELAHTIHEKERFSEDIPDYKDEVYRWIESGIAVDDKEMGDKIAKLVAEIPNTDTIIHGDFHTGNVLSQKGELMLIDMDGLSVGHPVFELSGLYMSYIAMGEKAPAVVEEFMGFSYEDAKLFFDSFVRHYFDDDTETAKTAVNAAALISYMRLYRKKGLEDYRAYYFERIQQLLKVVDKLYF